MPLRRNFFSSTILIFAGFLILLSLVSGCDRLSILQQPADKTEKALTSEYLAAVQAYQSGDYQVAAAAFSRVRDRTGDPLLARRSLFGQACAELMSANSREDFARAMGDWNSWVSQAPEKWECENPLLLVPLVNEKISVPEVVIPAPPASDSTGRQKTDENRLQKESWKTVQLKTELEQVKKQLEQSNSLAAERQVTINALTKKLETLKEQLKAIELIDQKIQEKKKAIPSTQ